MSPALFCETVGTQATLAQLGAAFSQGQAGYVPPDGLADKSIATLCAATCAEHGAGPCGQAVDYDCSHAPTECEVCYRFNYCLSAPDAACAAIPTHCPLVCGGFMGALCGTSSSITDANTTTASDSVDLTMNSTNTSAHPMNVSSHLRAEDGGDDNSDKARLGVGLGVGLGGTALLVITALAVKVGMNRRAAPKEVPIISKELHAIGAA